MQSKHILSRIALAGLVAAMISSPVHGTGESTGTDSQVAKQGVVHKIPSAIDDTCGLRNIYSQTGLSTSDSNLMNICAFYNKLPIEKTPSEIQKVEYSYLVRQKQIGLNMSSSLKRCLEQIITHSGRDQNMVEYAHQSLRIMNAFLENPISVEPIQDTDLLKAVGLIRVASAYVAIDKDGKALQAGEIGDTTCAILESKTYAQFSYNDYKDILCSLHTGSLHSDLEEFKILSRYLEGKPEFLLFIAEMKRHGLTVEQFSKVCSAVGSPNGSASALEKIAEASRLLSEHKGCDLRDISLASSNIDHLSRTNEERPMVMRALIGGYLDVQEKSGYPMNEICSFSEGLARQKLEGVNSLIQYPKSVLAIKPVLDKNGIESLALINDLLIRYNLNERDLPATLDKAVSTLISSLALPQVSLDYTSRKGELIAVEKSLGYSNVQDLISNKEEIAGSFVRIMGEMNGLYSLPVSSSSEAASFNIMQGFDGVDCVIPNFHFRKDFLESYKSIEATPWKKIEIIGKVHSDPGLVIDVFSIRIGGKEYR